MPIPGGEITTTEIWVTPVEETNEPVQETQEESTEGINQESSLPTETAE